MNIQLQVDRVKRHALAAGRLALFEADVLEAERLTGQPFRRGRAIIAQARTRIAQERNQP
jgi:hypothetical protein